MIPMKASLAHLSDEEQDDIHQIVDIIQSVASLAMIILFGSTARGDRVDKHYNELRPFDAVRVWRLKTNIAVFITSMIR